MTFTIGLVANVYNEANALPGWLETHLPFFDDVRVLHTGPQGEYSTDGTIEILERWGVPHEFGSIDHGFGEVRSRLLRMCPCDYVMILDADERFYPIHRLMACMGDQTPQLEADKILSGYDFRGGKTPDWDDLARLGADLKVSKGFVYDQGLYLRNMLEARPDAVCTVRRHWHNLWMTRPTQNWQIEPDWQMRIVRTDPNIHFESGTKMHERLVGTEKVSRADMMEGPFFDHFHFHFKRLEQDQRAHDVAVYDAIHEGKKPPTSVEFREGGK